MANIVARETFQDFSGLISALDVGGSVSGLYKALSKYEYKIPKKTTLERIVYSHQLMLKQVAQPLREVVLMVADERGIEVPESTIKPVVYGSVICGLGSALSKISDQKSNMDLNHVSDIANHVGISEELLWAVSRGKFIAIPHALAIKIAIAASQILGLSQPLSVQSAGEYNPIGGFGLEENKKKPYECAQTKNLRAQVLSAV